MTQQYNGFSDQQDSDVINWFADAFKDELEREWDLITTAKYGYIIGSDQTASTDEVIEGAVDDPHPE